MHWDLCRCSTIRESALWHLVPTRFITSDPVDRITSILVSRFILSLRQFDNQTASATYSGAAPGAPGYLYSADMLQFAARPSDSLPSFIASFAHPVHVESVPPEMEPDALVDNGSGGREMDVATPAPDTEDDILPGGL